MLARAARIAVAARIEVLEEIAMKASYDPKTDTLSFILKENAQVAESDEDKPGVILDYDSEGHLVGLEILDASKQVPDFASIQFRVAV